MVLLMKTIKTHPITQSDYTLIEKGYHLCLPLEIGVLMPADDSVRLLDALMDMNVKVVKGALTRRSVSGRADANERITSTEGVLLRLTMLKSTITKSKAAAVESQCIIPRLLDIKFIDPYGRK